MADFPRDAFADVVANNKGFAAGFDEPQRVALAFHIRQHLVVLVDQGQSRRARFEPRRRSRMCKPHWKHNSRRWELGIRRP